MQTIFLKVCTSMTSKTVTLLSNRHYQPFPFHMIKLKLCSHEVICPAEHGRWHLRALWVFEAIIKMKWDPMSVCLQEKSDFHCHSGIVCHGNLMRLIQDYLGLIPKLSSQVRCYHSGMKNLGTWNDVACPSPKELGKGFASGLWLRAPAVL